MNLTLEVIPMKVDRPSLKAFKNYMCNKYEVKNVDDIDMPIKEYADLMEVFEAGYAAKEKEIIDRLFKKMEADKEIMDATEKKAFDEWIEDNGDEGGTLYMTFSDEELEKIFLTAYERGKHEKEQMEGK